MSELWTQNESKPTGHRDARLGVNAVLKIGLSSMWANHGSDEEEIAWTHGHVSETWTVCAGGSATCKCHNQYKLPLSTSFV